MYVQGKCDIVLIAVFGETNKNMHRIKENVDWRNLNSKFHCSRIIMMKWKNVNIKLCMLSVCMHLTVFLQIDFYIKFHTLAIY